MSDNGPQFSSQEFHDFSTTLAEHAVYMVKKPLQSSKDPFLALLSYRTTPLPWCNFSTTELLMGRQLKTDVPQTKDHYILQWPHLKNLKEDHQKYKMPRVSITTNVTM